MKGNLERNRIYLVSPDSFSMGLDGVESGHVETDWNTSGVERSTARVSTVGSRRALAPGAARIVSDEKMSPRLVK